MLAGVAFQLGISPSSAGLWPFLAKSDYESVALVVYVSLAAEFVLRYAYDQPFKRAGHTHAHREPVERSTKLMLMGLGVESIFLLIRYVIVVTRFLCTSLILPFTVFQDLSTG